MSRTVSAAAVALVSLILLSSAAVAAPLAAYDLVGTDKKGDGVLPLATGANYPECGTGFSCDKYDILTLEAGADADNIHLKISPAAPYFGMSGVMYVVHFEAGGKKYFTCWNIHSAGTTTQNE